MKISATTLAAVVACASLTAPLCETSEARETVLVIGDSLSREYQFEFSTFPDARNWVELLAVHRPDDFYFGDLEPVDLGVLADACDILNLDHPVCTAIGDDGKLERYRYNWAIPTYSAEDYADDLTRDGIFDVFEKSFQDLINDDFDNVDAVVIFLGGNDIDSVYGPIYNGSSSTNNIVRDIEDDLEKIVDFVLDDTPGMKIVLVNVPHVGATPEVKANHPTDPVKTGRVTAALESLDTNLRALANAKGIGYADILPLTKVLLSDEPYCIGGVPFTNGGTDSGDPNYFWLGGEISQNFHPNTNGQALIANSIIAGFNEKYGLGVQPIGEAEIVEEILGLQTPLTQWAAGFGLPANQQQADDDPEEDGLENLIEFALDLDPTKFSSLPTPTATGDSFEFQYSLRPQACDHITITPEFSSDLNHWEPVPAENITSLPNHTFNVNLPKANPTIFLRLKVSLGT